jgi:uncharacterized cupredoxin-like copper-binding protein
MRIIGGTATERDRRNGRARGGGARIPAIALTALVALVGVSACGSDSNEKASGTKTSEASSHEAPPVVDVTASGAKDHWTFDVPATVTGGVVTFRLTNKSASDTHDLQLAKVDGTHSKEDVLKIVSSEDAGAPEWLHGYGGVGTVAPGQTGSATMNLPAGHYIYFCTDDTDGTGHADHGMYGEFDVKGASGAAMPAATAQIKAHEYKFDTTGLKAGKNVVRFTNTGKQLHMVLAVPIKDGKTIDDVKTAFSSDDHSTEPPVDFEKAVSTEVLDPGLSLVTSWNLSSGKYALICFMTDRAGGPPHFMSGMLQELDVA